MFRSLWRFVLVAASALLLGGCVKVYVVGHMDDWSDYVTGTGSADPLAGVSSGELTFAKLGITCTGTFRDYAPGRGRGEGRCSDQRVFKIETQGLSMSRGRGRGTDQLGHSGEFDFFTDIRDYERELARVRAEVERRNLDIAHLRLPRVAPGTVAIAAPANPSVVTTLRPAAPAAMGGAPAAAGLFAPSPVPAPVAAPASIAPAPAPPVAIAPPGPAAQPQVGASPLPAGGKRLALVIGNGTYKDAPLRNPVNDARALSTRLSTLGFEVMVGENLGQCDMTRLIARFGERLAGHDVGMFFFAGHGIQIRGKN